MELGDYEEKVYNHMQDIFVWLNAVFQEFMENNPSSLVAVKTPAQLIKS